MGLTSSLSVFPFVVLVEILFRNGKTWNKKFILNSGKFQKNKKNLSMNILLVVSLLVMSSCIIFTFLKGKDENTNYLFGNNFCNLIKKGFEIDVFQTKNWIISLGVSILFSIVLIQPLEVKFLNSKSESDN